MSKLLHQTSIKNLNTVLDDSFLPEMYSLKESFSSQWLSNFLERLATKEMSMNSFYNSLIAGEDETLIFVAAAANRQENQGSGPLHHLTQASRSLLVTMPTRAPSFITGSLLILCSIISSAAF